MLALISPALAYGQDGDDFEVFGGFSALHVDVDDDGLGVGSWAYGGMAELTWFVTDWFGIGGEVAYHRYSPQIPPNIFIGGDIRFSQTTFLAGMRFRYKNTSRFVPSARVMMGVGHASADVLLTPRRPWDRLPEFWGQPFRYEDSDNSFTVALGGSLDINLNDRIAIRAVQPDIVITNYGDSSADIRISTGLLVRF
jgi:hypothetical protein